MYSQERSITEEEILISLKGASDATEENFFNNAAALSSKTPVSPNAGDCLEEGPCDKIKFFSCFACRLHMLSGELNNCS